MPAIDGKRGRPRKRPEKIQADKGCDYPMCRQYLQRRGIVSRIARRCVLPSHPSSLPAKPAALRLKQTVKATILSCALQMVKMRDGLTEEVLPDFERLCAAVAEQ
ncbi:hypothetical protein [Desulfocurvibacter africanus]|uniref:hypothetical protein n=1 Tax=Desulfocurvibacter africanus TaxID=873 RepID=UPI0002F52D82